MPLVLRTARARARALAALARHAALSALAALALLSACSAEPELAAREGAIAESGPWAIPPDTLAVGDAQLVAYEGAGPWVGEAGCAGGLTTGAAILRAYLAAHFEQITAIGGYACRPVNGSATTMSLHATGRALDVFVPVFGAARDADNGLGDPIANWLVENAEALGVQYVIWDERSWKADRAPGAKDAPYTGASPHHDHVHVELSVEAAAEVDDWFSGVVPPPPPLVCPALPPEGGILDEQGACFEAFGPSRYFRVVAGAGWDGALLYTNAWDTDAPSNSARWNVALAAPGAYEVSVYLAAPYNAHTRAHYEVRAGGHVEALELDQSASTGFVSLGVFDFAGMGDEWVAVYDDAPGPVPDETHVTIDAVRLVRVGGLDEAGLDGGLVADGGAVPPDAGEGIATPRGRAAGCGVGGPGGRARGGGALDAAAIALALLAAVRLGAARRHRRVLARGHRAAPRRPGC